MVSDDIAYDIADEQTSFSFRMNHRKKYSDAIPTFYRCFESSARREPSGEPPNANDYTNMSRTRIINDILSIWLTDPSDIIQVSIHSDDSRIFHETFGGDGPRPENTTSKEIWLDVSGPLSLIPWCVFLNNTLIFLKTF